MRKFAIALAAAATAATAMPSVAVAQHYDRHGHGAYHGRYAHYYYGRGYYHGPRWRGRDGRYYCRRSDGTTGLLLGGAAGALVGRSVDTRGERATGTILGAVAGALIGREIDRGDRCR
jgi:uncharacterized protein YcfJ